MDSLHATFKRTMLCREGSWSVLIIGSDLQNYAIQAKLSTTLVATRSIGHERSQSNCSLFVLTTVQYTPIVVCVPEYALANAHF